MIIQCKHSGGFKPTEIEKWIEFSDDFFDLSKPADSFGTRYNDCKNNEVVEGKYLKVSRGFSGHICGVFLHNRGQFVSGQQCRKRFRTSCHRQGREAHKSNCAVRYIGAQQLWEQAQRRPPKSKTLLWSNHQCRRSKDLSACKGSRILQFHRRRTRRSGGTVFSLMCALPTGRGRQ